MVERKIFGGVRLRRLRLRLGLSQSQMAVEIGVSPSYLNLIERNQRPLTVQVLLKLSSVYGIDVAELSGEPGGAVEALKEVFSDPLLAGEIATPAELTELAEAAPNAARGMVRLHTAWREALERLSDLSHRLADGGGTPAEAVAPLPHGRAAAFFEEADPWFPPLEEAAEELAPSFIPRDDPAAALRTHLRTAFGVELRILPAHVMPVEQARYDRHTQRLYISARVPLLERPFLMARQIALLGHRELLDRLTREAGIAAPEAARLCRLGFARRLAEALLAPAGRLTEASGEGGADLIALADRFGLRPMRVMARLAALGGSGHRLPAAFMLVLDASGGVISRLAGAGFPFPRFGPLCARLPIVEALAARQQFAAELVLPDGGAFSTLTVADDGVRMERLPSPRRLALIGWRREEAGALLRDRLRSMPRPIGVTCRLCERLDCSHRMHPPIAQPAAFVEHVVGASDYELAG